MKDLIVLNIEDKIEWKLNAIYMIFERIVNYKHILQLHSRHLIFRYVIQTVYLYLNN